MSPSTGAAAMSEEATPLRTSSRTTAAISIVASAQASPPVIRVGVSAS